MDPDKLSQLTNDVVEDIDNGETRKELRAAIHALYSENARLLLWMGTMRQNAKMALAAWPIVALSLKHMAEDMPDEGE